MISINRVDISIVIPAYNEEKRLPPFLKEVLDFAEASSFSYEVIVVDDGSKDRTARVIERFPQHNRGLTTIVLKKNRGKGYAVKRGLFKARGNIRVFLDADGSTHPREIEKNLKYFDEGYDVVVGSREKRGPDQRLTRRWWRILIGKIFNFLRKQILGLPFLDTQCGFKMFKAHVIKPVFARMYLRRFGFDIEMLFLIYKCGFKAVEVPVTWEHKHGSKVNLVWDSLSMFVNILQVRYWHWTSMRAGEKYAGPLEYNFVWKLEQKHWWFQSRKAMLKNLVERMRVKNPKILNVSCGVGTNLDMLATLGEAAGVDPSPQAVALCSNKGMKNVFCADIEHLPFAEGTFDIVVVQDILERSADPLTDLEFLSRVLKSGGKMILLVPAFKMLWSRHDETLGHLRRYTQDDLKTLIEESGYSTEGMGYLFFTSFIVVAPFRILRRLFPFRRRWKSDTTTFLPSVVNKCMRNWCLFEYELSKKFPLPLGTSIYAVLSKARP